MQTTETTEMAENQAKTKKINPTITGEGSSIFANRKLTFDLDDITPNVNVELEIQIIFWAIDGKNFKLDCIDIAEQ